MRDDWKVLIDLEDPTERYMVRKDKDTDKCEHTFGNVMLSSIPPLRQCLKCNEYIKVETNGGSL